MLETLTGVLDTLLSFGWYAWALLVVGVIVGMLVGVLPGLTFVMGILLLVPFTFTMDTGPALILLVSLYVAGTYGGALTAILVNIPGEPNNVPLLWDGHSMKKQGRAAEALGWAAIAAVSGGFCAWLVLVLVAQPLADVVLLLGAPEFFAIVMLGLASVLVMTQGSYVAALIAMLAGMLTGTVGVDPVVGVQRYTFDSQILLAGVDYLIVLIGAYALGEVIMRFGKNFEGQAGQQPGKVSTTLPGLRALRDRSGSLARGIGTGTFMSGAPGIGATVSSFIAYNLEKQFGKHKNEVGKASPNGVIGPQSAATATVGGALLHLLVLGIPGSVATAVLLGVLLLHDVRPGPLIFSEQPEVVYTIFVAFALALVIMFVVGVLAVKPLIRLLSFPEVYIAASVVLFAFIGSFALRQSMSDVWIMVAFGVIGFLMQRKNGPIAPLVLGAVLGPLAERYFRRSMTASSNDWTVFFTRPISAVLMGLLLLMIAFLAYRAVRQSRERRKDLEPNSVSLKT